VILLVLTPTPKSRGCRGGVIKDAPLNGKGGTSSGLEARVDPKFLKKTKSLQAPVQGVEIKAW